ncbi:hypothetical protein L9F63_028193, partial [Diploptera punctata]
MKKVIALSIYVKIQLEPIRVILLFRFTSVTTTPTQICTDEFCTTGSLLLRHR